MGFDFSVGVSRQRKTKVHRLPRFDARLGQTMPRYKLKPGDMGVTRIKRGIASLAKTFQRGRVSPPFVTRP